MEIDRPGQSEDDIDVRLEWPSDPLASDRPAHMVPSPEIVAPSDEAGESPEDVDTDLATVRSELTELSRELAGVRADLSSLLGRKGGGAAPAGAIGDELAEALDPLVEEVAGLRSEVASLRRRISLRANGTPVELSDDQVQRIAIAISAHLSAAEGSGAQVRAR